MKNKKIFSDKESGGMSFIKKFLKRDKKKPKVEKEKKEEKKDLDVFVGRPKLNVLTKLYYIMAKNFKLILRSKISALLLLLGPLLIVFILALAFNTSTLYDLNVAVYSESYSTISEDIVSNLSTSQYNVIRMDSETDCIDAIKFDDFQVCVIFPTNMILDNSANKVITIYVDNSRMNIAHLISAEISSKVYISAEELSEDMVSSILTVLDSVNADVTQSQAVVTNINSLNSEATSSASGASSDLSAIDLTYSAVDATTVDSEIAEIAGDYNMSTSIFSDLSAAVSSIVSTYSSLSTKVDAASSSITTSNTDLSTLSSTLASQQEKITTVETNLNNMATNIDSIKITNVDNIVTPVRTSIQPISSSNNYLLYIIPSILLMIFMFVALLLSSSNIIDEKKSLAYFRNFITPTNDSLFIIGHYLSTILILTFEVAITLATLYYFVPSPGINAYLLSGAVLIVLCSLFIFMGMLIGYMFNTKETVTLTALSAGIILLFFSNTILPLETLSSVTRKIVFYNPYVLGESILKKLLLFNASFSEISMFFYLLIGFAIAVLAGAVFTRYLFKRFYSS